MRYIIIAVGLYVTLLATLSGINWGIQETKLETYRMDTCYRVRKECK